MWKLPAVFQVAAPFCVPAAVAEDSFAPHSGWHLVFGEDVEFFHFNRYVVV